MKKQTALFLSTMLTGIALATTSISAAPAADECLARPNGAAPAGKHWYYSTDRKLQKKCWYLDDAGEKVVTPAPRKQPVAAAAAPVEKKKTDEPPQNADARQPVDARAELVEEPRAEQPPAPAQVAPPAPIQPQTSPDAADATTKRDWTLASRWPEASDTFASAPPLRVADAAPAPRSEAAPTPALQEQSAVADDGSNGISIDLGLIAAGAIFLVVIGGMMVLLSRSNAAPRGRMFENTADRGERPWARRDAAAPMPMARPRERLEPRSRHDTIEEIEQLLEARRHAPG